MKTNVSIVIRWDTLDEAVECLIIDYSRRKVLVTSDMIVMTYLDLNPVTNNNKEQILLLSMPKKIIPTPSYYVWEEDL